MSKMDRVRVLSLPLGVAAQVFFSFHLGLCCFVLLLLTVATTHSLPAITANLAGQRCSSLLVEVQFKVLGHCLTVVRVPSSPLSFFFFYQPLLSSLHPLALARIASAISLALSFALCGSHSLPSLPSHADGRWYQPSWPLTSSVTGHTSAPAFSLSCLGGARVFGLWGFRV